MALATIIRLMVAGFTELSNDEVYYWTYALYPDWSHFDHPPMVGFLIQLFTLNDLLHHELFVRLGATIISAFNTWLVFHIGTLIRNERTGFYAAVLFTTSIYASLIAGTFIIPDAPQSFFWFVSMYLFLQMSSTTRISGKLYVSLGLAIALSVLSKYHGAFIGVGIFIFWIAFRRDVFKTSGPYLLIIIALLGLAPILWWNIQNDFISFTFHGERVSPSLRLRFDFLFMELGGQIAYNNPVNYVLIVLGLTGLIKGKKYFSRSHTRALLLMSLPLLVVFTSFALFKRTLPHWSGPAFNGLLFFGAAWLDTRKLTNLIPAALRASIGVITIPLVAAVLLINHYPGTIGNKEETLSYGRGDFTLDMYGWRQLGDKWTAYTQVHDLKNITVISHKWFPSAHIDFYLAAPNEQPFLSVGSLHDIHKYYWINKDRMILQQGDDAVYITVSNWNTPPGQYLKDHFNSITLLDTIEILRSGKTVRYAFIYSLKGYKGTL